MEEIKENNIHIVRTIPQCLDELKKIDPQTAITEWFLRCLCRDNKVKHYRNGNKIFICYDELLKYFGRDTSEVQNA